MKTAYALLRVSTPEQSLESQEEALLAIAKEKGFRIPEKYIFREKKTGYDEPNVDRQSIIDLRNNIALKKPDAIFILELSRLTRNGLKVYQYINEFSLTPKIPMYFGDFNLWTINPDTNEELRDNIFKLLGAAEAVEKERKRITERTTRGKNAAANKGLYAGHLSDGYKVVLNDLGQKIITPDEKRAPIIKRVFELYKEYSVLEIRDILNSEGVEQTGKYRMNSPLFKGYKKEYKDKTGFIKKRDNLLWTKNNILLILRNKWYIGIRTYNGKEHPIEPIITMDLWNYAQEKLTQRAVRSGKGKNNFLLSGLFFCGHCGKKIYGHYTGLCNHYYCSSVDDGKISCQARGVSKENVEGIIAKILMPRLIVSAIQQADTPVNKILSYEETTKKEYKKKIKTYKSIIATNQRNIEEIQHKLKSAIEERLNATDVSKPLYNDIISDYEAQIISTQKNTLQYEKEIGRLETSISRANSTKSMIKRLNHATMDEINTFFHLVIDKVILYNVDKYNSIIHIDYKAGFFDEFIYNERLFNGYFFPLGTIYLDASVPKLPEHVRDFWFPITSDYKYVRQGLSKATTLKYNPENKMIGFTGYQTLCYKDNYGFFVISDALSRIKNKCSEKGLEWDYSEIKNSISVEDYIKLFANNERALFAYERLEGLSEKALKQQERYRELQKKSNTGKPTCEPYIVKDAKYEEIQAKRKHLYNRVYKIKQNKSLSENDKRLLIMGIKRELKTLKYQINYFGDSNRAKKYQQSS